MESTPLLAYVIMPMYLIIVSDLTVKLKQWASSRYLSTSSSIYLSRTLSMLEGSRCLNIFCGPQGRPPVSGWTPVVTPFTSQHIFKMNPPQDAAQHSTFWFKDWSLTQLMPMLCSWAWLFEFIFWDLGELLSGCSPHSQQSLRTWTSCSVFTGTHRVNCQGNPCWAIVSQLPWWGHLQSSCHAVKALNSGSMC